MNKRVLICFLLLAPIVLKAQVLKNIQGAFNAYHQNAFQEKIFVHTDKEQYLTGELLWFKMYTVDAFTNLPTDLSKVAYVEILDQTNQPIVQTKISLKNGSGNGSLYLPLTALNGAYKFRAYTAWMQNFGPDHFFEKQITLVNPRNAPEKTKKAANTADLQFFAEGGDMVEGISSNIGFKAIAPDGKGITVKGVVINQKNDTVARFQSLKFGIGQFKFTPLSNQTYKVIATTDTKEIIIKDLPAAKKLGYTLFLEEQQNGLLNLAVGTNLPVGNVYVVVHQGNKIAVAEAASVTNGKAAFQIDQSKLTDGVSHFSLFNETGQAVAERLYFKRPIKSLKITANTNAQTYKTREKVTVTINSSTETYEPLAADLSIAVKKVDSLQGMDQTDIVSYFWLSAELKGTIESPSYYFRNPSTETDKALDNLLLTQGWRRMRWDDVLSKKQTFTFLPEFNGHLVTGKVNTPNTDLYLTISNTIQQFYNTTSDSSGRFVFNTNDFYGQNEIIVQTNTKIDTTSLITVQSPFSEKYTSFAYPDFELKPSQLNALQNQSLSVQVQNIYLAEQLKKVSIPDIDTLNFYGKPFKSYKLDDYVRFPLMEEVLREYVRETFVTKEGKDFVISVLGGAVLNNPGPLILVDGAPYFNTNRLMEVNPRKIKNLDVVRDYYIYNSVLFNGILNFTSYSPNVAASEINPNAVVLDYEGMQLQREFYMPNYDSADNKESRLPDFRSLLFWSPSTLIDSKDGGKLSFFTSDVSGTYIGIINGLSKTGVPGNGTFTFEVRP